MWSRLGILAAICCLLADPAVAAEQTSAAARSRACRAAVRRVSRHRRDGRQSAQDHAAVSKLAERFPVEMLVEALKTGQISGHDEMPMFVLEMEDMQALIAHIDSFAEPGSRYLAAPPK